MKRKIVILANSRMHNARCIAGKDIDGGEWIRLKNSSARSYNEGFPEVHLTQLIGNPKGPQSLDILEVSFSKRCPLPHQPENIYVDGKQWSKIDVYPKNELSNLIDDKECEWLGDKITFMDCVSESIVSRKGISSSLFFLHLTENNNPKISYEYNVYKKSYRPKLEFNFKEKQYNLVITDDFSYPTIKFDHLGINDVPDDKKLRDAYITLGLGEVYHGFYYKLVVNIIEIDRSYN